MKKSDIDRAFVACGLEALSREQLITIANSTAGKAAAALFERALGGDNSVTNELAVLSQAVAPGVDATLRKLGYRIDLQEFLILAHREQDKLFGVLRHAGATGNVSAADRTYLDGLGLPKHASSDETPQSASAPYYNFPVYAANAALCFSEATHRSSNQATVQIDGSIAMHSGSGKKAYDWQNKIVFQLNPQECFELLALLRGHLTRVEFAGHGKARDKAMHVEAQPGGYYLKLFQRDRKAVNVPFGPADAIRVSALLYRQIQANAPHMTPPLVDRMLPDMARNHSSCKSAA